MSDPRIQTSVEVEGDADGSGDVVIVRRATDPDARATLVHAADIVSGIDHPGIEAVLSTTSTSEATEVRLRVPGGRTLSSSPPRDAAGAARAVSGVAQVLADLHQLGLTHGPIGCQQVVLGGGARPALLDFSAGHRRSEVDEERWIALVADDVRGIGALVDELIELLPSDESTWGRERWARRRLAALGARSRATAHPATVVAQEAADLAVGRRRWPRLLPAACAVIGAVTLAAGIVGLARTHHAAETTAPAGPTIAVHGNELVVGGARFHLGRDGDQVVLGDWDDDGVTSPALLRPSTGEVFVFEQWPSPSHPLTNPPVTVVAGAVSADRRRSVHGSDRLVVVRRSGHPVLIDASSLTTGGHRP